MLKNLLLDLLNELMGLVNLSIGVDIKLLDIKFDSKLTFASMIEDIKERFIFHL
ncbi:hypothetical protein BpHYR1_030228 [Brachionus plicatilis]|uniref:Uncharacterized protein n=1 Tax=Brachionus plicatilis TaxID=10195 RepID=A0A3M7PFH4_BRAPC|nr:hypothetical protein BpHYR1_030228 [Brachionus plicatilis]